MKLLKKLLILLLGLSIGGIGCKKIEEADPTLGILFSQLVSQVSGACAEVRKVGTTYLARLTPIPKGGCNAETIYAGPDADTFANQTYEGLKAFYQEMTAYFPASSFPPGDIRCGFILANIITNESTIKTAFKNAYNEARDDTKVRFYGIDSIKQEITAYENNPYFNSMKTLSLDGYKNLARIHSYRSFAAGTNCGNDISTYITYNIVNITGESFSNHNLSYVPPPPPPPPALPKIIVGRIDVAGDPLGLLLLYNFDPFINPNIGSGFAPTSNSILWSVVCDYGTNTPLAVNCTNLNDKF
jgi:hypothetical protein